MKSRNMFVAGAAGILILGIAVPASAATGDTTATVTVQGGVLAITVPAAAANLGTLVDTVGDGGTISGPLGVVTVADGRKPKQDTGWVASVISTAFTGPGAETIAAKAVHYSAGSITPSGKGSATYTANNPQDLTAAVAAVTATVTKGVASATWTPTISVAIPGDNAAGVYTATITHSVL